MLSRRKIQITQKGAPFGRATIAGCRGQWNVCICPIRNRKVFLGSFGESREPVLIIKKGR